MVCCDPNGEQRLFGCAVSLQNRFVCHVWVVVREDGTGVQYAA